MNNEQSEGEYMEQFGHDIDSMPEPKQKKSAMPHRCKIAGIPHRRPDLSVLHLDDLVNLVAEPHNAYDPNAIKVMSAAGVQLGYIPKTDTHLVQGVAKMKIVRIEPSDKWNEVHIETV